LAAGGFAGDISGELNSSFSLGAVTSDCAGGFAGFYFSGNLIAAFWDTDTSGIADPNRGACNVDDTPGITGLTDAQLTSRLPVGFDPKIWDQSPNINNGYPYLRANPPQ
jgi:hypothetical protein